MHDYEVVNPPYALNPPADAGEPIDAPSCPQCGGEGQELGERDSSVWFQCSGCGWEYNRRRNPFFAPPAIQYVSGVARPGQVVQNPFFAPPALAYSSRVARPGMLPNPSQFGADAPFAPGISPFNGMRNPVEVPSCVCCGAIGVPLSPTPRGAGNAGLFCAGCDASGCRRELELCHARQHVRQQNPHDPLSTSWTGKPADYVSPPGSYGVVGHSELAMHTRIAGKPVTRYALWRDEGGRVRWAHVEAAGKIVDGLPGEVLPDEVRREIGWALTNPKARPGSISESAYYRTASESRRRGERKRVMLHGPTGLEWVEAGRGGAGYVYPEASQGWTPPPRGPLPNPPKKCKGGFHDYDPVTFLCRRRGCGVRRDEPGQTYAFGKDAQPASFLQETLFGAGAMERPAPPPPPAMPQREEPGQGGFFKNPPRVTLTIGGQTYPAEPHGDYVIVDGVACPACKKPLLAVGTGARQESHDTYVSEAVCLDCRAPLGQIRAVVSTIFGIEEDERMTQGPWKVYNPAGMTLEESAEAWARGRGLKIPKRGSPAWRGLYESWIKHGMANPNPRGKRGKKNPNARFMDHEAGKRVVEILKASGHTASCAWGGPKGNGPWRGSGPWQVKTNATEKALDDAITLAQRGAMPSGALGAHAAQHANPRKSRGGKRATRAYRKRR